MKRNTALIGAITLAVAASSIPAVAQERGQGPRGPLFQFEEFDANSDGKITQDEIDAHAAARFAAADTNGDGSLSADELLARLEEQRAERMKRNADRMVERRDANNDGVLSPDEMAPRNGARLFSRLDANNDGEITKEEAEQARAKMQERRDGQGKRFGDHRKGERGHGDWKKRHNN
jgi:Ca2+-binding EF-hand superfamily protein